MEAILCSFEKKYSEIMRMKRYSHNTEESYIYHWRRFKEFKATIHETRLSSQDINDYLVFLNTKNVSDSYFNQSINAIRFMFQYVFNRKIKNYLVVRPKKAHISPMFISQTITPLSQLGVAGLCLTQSNNSQQPLKVL